MRIDIDRGRCSGHAICAVLAPTVYDLGDDGIAVVLEPEPTGADLDAAMDALRECPAVAITRKETA